MLNGAMPRLARVSSFRTPLLGFSSKTHEIATSREGMILGTTAVSSKNPRKGAFVRTVIQASTRAKTTDSPEAPAAKSKVLAIRRYVSGSV